ncbi:MAG: translation initiation factor, partial [Patescibacteria group bacterium]|nr:translation initiation factor [Patescibacteria group bacterium]
YGFDVSMPQNVKQITMRENVSVRLYKVIYELIDDARKEMSNLLLPEEIVTQQGSLVVKAVFKTSKNELICGGEVSKGQLVIPSLATIYRKEKVIAADLPVVMLKHGPTETKQVPLGQLCGISLETTSRLEIEEGDRIDLYTSEIHERSL